MTNTNEKTEVKQETLKWKCNECGFEFYGLSIVCPSCEFADVERIEE